ncbi:MAG: hypothetical protein LBT20_07520 [Clostridiales bacterium]|jgi:hypothetical protein|nr:hypothetical protein [Clostridiales bacterium]
MPFFEVLEALCDALQISFVQLFSESKESELPEEHKKVLEYWSTLNRGQKDLILNMMISLRGTKTE